MAELVKKSKENKIHALNKIADYVKKYNTVVVVENSGIQNRCLQKLRSSIDGKVVFAKKSLLQKKFPSLSYEENFFLIFTNNNELKKIESFEFCDFIKTGEMAIEDHVIPAGPVRNEKLAGMLAPIEKKGALSILKENYIVIKKGDVADEKAEQLQRLTDVRSVMRNLSLIDKFDAVSLKEL